MSDSDRGNHAATPAPSCQLPSATLVQVRVIDKGEAPVAGVVVTLNIDGDREGAVANTDGRGIAIFDGVASCASIGIWVSRGGSDLGFAQVRLRPGGDRIVTVRIHH